MIITTTSRSLRFALIAALLAIAPGLVFAKDSSLATPDSAATQLALTGAIPVKTAGPYVEVGTFRIQVITKLGAPHLRLADGSWLYQGFEVNNSDASGALLVRFTAGRVSELSLLTPATVLALQSASRPESERALLVARVQR